MHKLLLAVLLFPAAAFAQLEHARSVTETLCSPAFHGRGYVNGGDSIAADFVKSEFENARCLFFKTGAFQSFQFDVNTFPAEMRLSINGQALVPGEDFVVDPSSGGGTGMNFQIISLTYADFEKASNLKQKSNEIRKLGNAAFSVSTIGLKGDSLKVVRKGIVELLEFSPVIEFVSGKFTWSVGHEQYNRAYFQVMADAISVKAERSTMDYAVSARMRKHTARNVIAYVPAKRRSRKRPYLIFTAHYDHLGRMGQETYFPGGNDNASGTAMLIEMARYFKEHPLKNYNVAFIAFAGEEAGLIGSNYYVQHPVFPLKKIRFLFNVDIMGSGEEGATVVNATLFPEEFKSLTTINEKEQLLVKIGSRGEAANSDHYWFTKAGVPAFFMYTMGPNKHYHDVYDTYAELSFSEFADIQRLLIAFAEGF